MGLMKKLLEPVKPAPHDPLAHDTSQAGEDYIIGDIFRRLGVSKGCFVEFGAWDGKVCSNTHSLMHKGWSGLYIEGDAEKFKTLQRNMKSFPSIKTMCRFIMCEGPNSLDAILGDAHIPPDFDLLSIDIDGNDYWVWKSLVKYRPKLVVIEYNSNFTAEEKKTVPYNPQHVWDGTMFYGASAAALAELAQHKGYKLVSFTPMLNVFFLREDLCDSRFGVVPVQAVTVGPNHKQQRRQEFVDV